MKEGMLQCSNVGVPGASTQGSHSSEALLGEAQDTPGENSKVLTVPPKFFPWMRLSKLKPGAGNSNCTAFGDVLGILLLVFPWVPSAGSAWLCSALRIAVEGDSRRETEKTRSVWVSLEPWVPGINVESYVWREFFSFLGSTFKIRVFPNCHINKHIKNSTGRLLQSIE